MTCDNCGAPMRLSRDQGLMICDYCSSQATPRPDEDGVIVMGATSHNCPVCDTPLANASIESQQCRYCTRCHGMLLEMEKFVSLLDLLREYRYWSRSSSAPRDLDSGGVLWLDRGELSRIVAAPDRDPRPISENVGVVRKSR